MATSDFFNDVQKAYIAYYQRPGDPTGVNFWAQALDVSGATVDDIIDAFSTTPESQSLYGPINDSTIGDVVDAMYLAMFNRAPDAAGKQFYVDGFLNGSFTAGSIALDILNGATNSDAIAIDNKVEAANRFSETIDPGLDGLAPFDATYAGNDDAVAARSWLADVTSDPTSRPNDADTTQFIQDSIADPGDPILDGGGEGPLTLTTAIETTTGTTGDDVFTAPLDFAPGVGATNTLQTGDVVAGNGGVDELDATVAPTTFLGSPGGPIVPTLTDVKNLQVTDHGSAGLNLTTATGLENVAFVGSTAGSSVFNLPNLVDLSASNIVGNQFVGAGYLDSVLAGSDDTQNVALTNASVGNLQFSNSSGNFNGPGLETVAVSTTGSNNVVSVAGSAAQNVTTSVSLEGDGITLGNFSAQPNLGNLANSGLDRLSKLTSFDSSAATGDVNVVVASNTDNVVDVKTGVGDDTVVLGDTLTEDDTVDLGEGSNTLTIEGSADKSSYQVSNVDTLQVFTQTKADVVNAKVLGVDAIEVVSTNNTDGLTINGQAATGTVTVTDDKGAGTNALANLTVIGASTIGSDDTVSLTLHSQDAVPGGKAPFEAPTLTVTNGTFNQYENLAIESTGVADSSNAIANLTANAQNSVTITGDRELQIGSKLTAATVDASELTSNLNVTATGNASTGGVQSVTAGVGNDRISIDSDGLDSKQSIIAGDGVDTLLFTNNGPINFAGFGNADKLSGLDGFENIGLNDNANTTLLLDTISLGAFTDSSVNVVATGKGGGTVTLDTSDVLLSNAQIGFDATGLNKGFGNAAFSISNGVDTFLGSKNADSATVSNAVYIQATDTLNGADGADTLIFDTAAGAGVDQTVTAAQLAGVSSFQNVVIADTEAAANKFNVTLDNSFVANNADLNGDLSVSAAGVVNDTVTVDASAAAGSFDIALTGGDQGDTLKTGSGDDALTGGLGNDTITTGGGKDSVVYNTGDGVDVLTDMDFGSLTGTGANVDTLDVSAILSAAASPSGTGDVVGQDLAGTLAGADILIMNQTTYADLTLAEGAWNAAAGLAAGEDVAVFWVDNLQNVHFSVDTDGGTNGVGADDLATLQGMSINEVAASVDGGDVLFA